jgi:hypothetical protein
MRLISRICFAVGIATAIAMTASAVDARSRYHGGYAAHAGGRDFVYGANRAPYGRDKDNPRDFQLQGTH